MYGTLKLITCKTTSIKQNLCLRKSCNNYSEQIYLGILNFPFNTSTFPTLEAAHSLYLFDIKLHKFHISLQMGSGSLILLNCFCYWSLPTEQVKQPIRGWGWKCLLQNSQKMISWNFSYQQIPNFILAILKLSKRRCLY